MSSHWEIAVIPDLHFRTQMTPVLAHQINRRILFLRNKTGCQYRLCYSGNPATSWKFQERNWHTFLPVKGFKALRCWAIHGLIVSHQAGVQWGLHIHREKCFLQFLGYSRKHYPYRKAAADDNRMSIREEGRFNLRVLGRFLSLRQMTFLPTNLWKLWGSWEGICMFRLVCIKDINIISLEVEESEAIGTIRKLEYPKIWHRFLIGVQKHQTEG